VCSWGEPGAYRLAQPLEAIQVPATVTSGTGGAYRPAAAGGEGLLQTAAAIGTDVPFPRLQAIAELPEATLHRSLAHMQAADFLYEKPLQSACTPSSTP